MPSSVQSSDNEQRAAGMHLTRILGRSTRTRHIHGTLTDVHHDIFDAKAMDLRPSLTLRQGRGLPTRIGTVEKSVHMYTSPACGTAKHSHSFGARI